MPINNNWGADVLAALQKLAESPSNTWEQATSYAALPAASACAGSTWLVLEGTGIWPTNKPSGWYYSDGASWSYLGSYNPVITGGNVVVSNFPSTYPVTGPLTDVQLRAVPIPVLGSVDIGNFPAVQPVNDNGASLTIDGTIAVSNFPATQPVSGSVSVSNFPAIQPVSGTFWPVTQPVSGTVSVGNFPATQPVSGTVAVSGTIPVSGTFFQVTQPVSVASIPLPSGASTEATLALIKAKTDNLDVLLSTRTKPADTQTIAGSVSVSNLPATQPVSGTFWQATQPISGAVSIANFPASQAVTGTFWQATQPVSGPLTDIQLRASALPVSGTFFPATQPVSGTLNTVEDRVTGRTTVLKTGTLVTTAVTADQVILTYTVTAGKTFFLEYLTVIGRLTVIGATASIMGTLSLETPSGTKAWTVTWTNPTISLVQPVVLTFGEPLPIAAGTVVRFVCTPAATTSMTWIGNFGGYEK